MPVFPPCPHDAGHTYTIGQGRLFNSGKGTRRGSPGLPIVLSEGFVLKRDARREEKMLTGGIAYDAGRSDSDLFFKAEGRLPLVRP